jgi:signal transduction histidine kinase
MRIPTWARSVRFRLAMMYSVVVFTLAVLVVGAINIVLSRSLEGEPVSEDLSVRRVSSEQGVAIFLDESAVTSLERLANEEAIDRLRTTSVISLLVLFPASVGVGFVIAGRIVRPVEHITDVARDIQASDLSRRIRLEGPDDELKRLADTFDEMLDRVETGVEDQRRFIQDTSHELRNPLATMAMSLDVALATPSDHAGLEETARLVRRTLDRTSRTVDDLTRFARRELPNRAADPVDLGALARDVAKEYRLSGESRHITVEHVGELGPTVRGDRSALHAAVANLTGNAVRLAPEGSRVWCGAGRRDGWAWVGVCDQGPGIAEDDHPFVFRRNWGRDRSGLYREPRTGIGLSIVRQVAEACGGAVTLTSSPGQGSSFVIWLPLGDAGDRASVTHDGVHPIADPLWGAERRRSVQQG